MKITGKVVTFDGNFGKIIGTDNHEYLIFKNEVCDDIKENDSVMFVPETFEDVELSKNIARFITRISQ